VNSTWNAFLGLISFLAIIAMLGLVYKKLTRKINFGEKSSRYIKSIDRFPLSNDKWLEIIEVGNKILLLGITGTEIIKIDNLNLEDLNEIIRDKSQISFTSILGKYNDKHKG